MRLRSRGRHTFTPGPGLVRGAEVIVVAKFPAGSRPLFYRQRIGKGTVCVNAWTQNIYGDSESRNDFGWWDYDWLFGLSTDAAGVKGIDFTRGAGFWLRNTRGVFLEEPMKMGHCVRGGLMVLFLVLTC